MWPVYIGHSLMPYLHSVQTSLSKPSGLGILSTSTKHVSIGQHAQQGINMLLQTALATAEGELEDTDLEVADLPAPAVPAAAAGEVEKSKKKRKAKSDEGNGASGSKDAPPPPQVCLLPRML